MPSKDPAVRKAWEDRNADLLRAKRHAYYIRNREKMIQRAARWKAANLSANCESSKRYNARNPEKVLIARLRMYSLTPEKYDTIYSAQGGVCAICGRAETAKHMGKTRAKLSVDHDHRCCPRNRSCGKCIRGLLCHACNQGIGRFGDDPDRIRKAAAYLERR